MAKKYTGQEASLTLMVYRDDGTSTGYSILQAFSWNSINYAVITEDAWLKLDVTSSATRCDAFTQYVASIEGWDVASTVGNQPIRTGSTCINQYVFNVPTTLSAPSTAGETQFAVSCLLNSLPIGWTVVSKPSWVNDITGVGTNTPKIVCDANAGAARPGNVILQQADSGTQKTMVVTQAAFVAPTGNVYAGARNEKQYPTTEAQVKGLLLQIGTNPVKANAKKGDVINYQTPIGIMVQVVVVPATITAIASIYDLDNSQEVGDIFTKSPTQVTVDSVVCDVWYLYYLETAGGTKNLRLTL